jgi:hypothetical protein
VMSSCEVREERESGGVEIYLFIFACYGVCVALGCFSDSVSVGLQAISIPLWGLARVTFHSADHVVQ